MKRCPELREVLGGRGVGATEEPEALLQGSAEVRLGGFQLPFGEADPTEGGQRLGDIRVNRPELVLA